MTAVPRPAGTGAPHGLFSVPTHSQPCCCWVGGMAVQAGDSAHGSKLMTHQGWRCSPWGAHRGLGAKQAP